MIKLTRFHQSNQPIAKIPPQTQKGNISSEIKRGARLETYNSPFEEPKGRLNWESGYKSSRILFIPNTRKKKNTHTHTHTRNKPALHTKNTSNGIITRKAARPRWQNLLKNLLCSSPVAYCNIYNTEELADLRHRRKKRKRRRTRKALGFDRFREEQKEKQTVNDTSPDSLPTPCETHNYSRAHTHTRGKKNWEAPR